jgi:predicted transcriptional regulator
VVADQPFVEVLEELLSTSRRPMGALEAAVLEQVWAHPDGVTPRQVLQGLPDDLAYTTVMTILNRLWTKGILDRERDGRAYRYRPIFTECELVASRMSDALDVASDRLATLSRFVEDLSTDDEALLRELLDRET